jgi:oxygen-dependent protoporphyrinogen oxidase
MSHIQHLVIGGGISGIAATYFLKKQGRKVKLLEKNNELGGRVAPIEFEGSIIEFGGKNIGRRYHLFRSFVCEMGDFNYVNQAGHQMTPNQLSAENDELNESFRRVQKIIASVPEKDGVRLLEFLLRVALHSQNRLLSSEYFAQKGREADHAPLSAYFGQEMCSALRSLRIRISGAEIDETYLGNFGCDLGMLLDSYDQIADGFGSLLEAFKRCHQVQLATRLIAIHVEGSRVVGARVEHFGKVIDLECQSIILATTAPAAAALLQPVAPKASEILGRFIYYPTTVLVAKYNRDIFNHNLHEIYFDSDSPLSKAGVQRHGAYNMVRYTFAGRSARSLIAPNGLCDDELIILAEKLLAQQVPVKASERLAFRVHPFRPGVCAHSPFHAENIAALNQEIDSIQGLRLIGDYVEGTSIEACFNAAHACVDSITS